MTSKPGIIQLAHMTPYVKDTFCKKMGTNLAAAVIEAFSPPVYEVTTTNNYASEERPFYDDLLIVT